MVNIRKESVRFVRIHNTDPPQKASSVENISPTELKNIEPEEVIDKGVNIEFVFDADCRCAITVYYLCQEEVTPAGVT
jgi:hypothetical protein